MASAFSEGKCSPSTTATTSEATLNCTGWELEMSGTPPASHSKSSPNLTLKYGKVQTGITRGKWKTNPNPPKKYSPKSIQKKTSSIPTVQFKTSKPSRVPSTTRRMRFRSRYKILNAIILQMWWVPGTKALSRVLISCITVRHSRSCRTFGLHWISRRCTGRRGSGVPTVATWSSRTWTGTSCRSSCGWGWRSRTRIELRFSYDIYNK